MNQDMSNGDNDEPGRSALRERVQQLALSIRTAAIGVEPPSRG